jgi:hypothetical protein
VIGHLVILHPNRTSLIAAHPRSHLTPTISRTITVDRGANLISNPRGENPQRQLAIQVLRSLGLTTDLDSGRPVASTHR